MPRGSRSLLDRSRLLNGDAVSNINCGEEVIGWTYKGEKYYMGLLLKTVHRDRLELVICPHADDIWLHLQSGWGQPFLKKTVVMFSMQFLRTGDWVRIVRGDLSSETSQVISTDHPANSATLELTLSGRRKEVDIRLDDIDRVFWVGDTVQVIAGPYLGVEGHIIQMADDTFRLCQHASKEELEHSCQLSNFSSPPPDIDAIQIGDSVNVLVEEHMGKTGIVRWLSKGGNYLWFQDGSLIIPVPIVAAQRIPNLQTLQFTQDRGYDVRPGDVVRVACGPNYTTKGVIRRVDFINAHLTLLSEIDHSLVNVPIGFVIKLQNASLDSFKKDIRQEVFIIGSDRKGYQATLYSFSSETCTVAIHGQQRTTIQLKDVVTRYGMRLNGIMLEGTEMLSFCEIRRKLYLAPPPRSVTPPPEKIHSSLSASTIDKSSSTWTTWTSSSEDIVTAGNPSSLSPSQAAAPDPWSVNINDVLDGTDGGEKPKETPLAWLMNKEFSYTFTTYHTMLKVSPSFMRGRLHN
ncbi:hypothetical protein DFJ58DRAFT_731007 [Suillus subalutaceus]|uniref:uncharacterized protein n=1 Tax=Suillus subalutaceus TaxID=48586 RepID=UPI001B87F38E|nr:uncharacterized protein DFJ58DRAFT_731007 [Suillus subalutaceus]KAG1844931.1 hypothetical protein DFJ58DRAFT_731007 [Suillus subalutaceus]